MLTISLMYGTTTVAAEETTPSATSPCFPGAYYRKAVSSFNTWTGIDGIVTLPQPHFDPDRRDPKTSKVLDNPSIYMGGHSDGQEIDAGVTWEVIKEPNGSVSRERKAYRPFWRNEKWANAPATPQYYYYPGDTLKISITTPADGQMRMDIVLLARAGDAASTGTTFTLESMKALDPISSFSTSFEATNFGPNKQQQFKRVNAIDQSGNEEKDVSPTRTRVTGAKWHSVSLHRGDSKLPMTKQRITDMRCPDPTHHLVSSIDENGGEAIDIVGTPG